MGHQVFEEGEDIVSSPIVVRAEPQRLAVRLGKQRWLKIRPSIIVAELKRLRERSERGSGLQDTLETLYTAAKHLDPHPGVEGSVRAKFRDIYDLFALAPGWKKENPEASFAQTLFALHRSEIRFTRNKRKFEFEFPTGHPKERDMFSTIDETGRTIRYYMAIFR